MRMMHEGNTFPNGRVFVLAHLQSDRGKELNGRRCIVVGRDEIKGNKVLGLRIHVRLLNLDSMEPEGERIRVIKRNLIPRESYYPIPSTTVIPKKELLQRLNRAMAHAKEQGHHDCNGPGEFRDRMQRYNYLAKYLPNEVPPPSKCMDYMIPDKEQKYYELLRNESIPACIGNGFVNFERFSEGLIGSGQECTICQESTTTQDQVIRLPCGHTFHVSCASNWLMTHASCPSCRKEPINPWPFYLLDSDKQTQIRIHEWFLSGMCERCQAVYHENDPIVHGGEDAKGNPILAHLSRALSE